MRLVSVFHLLFFAFFCGAVTTQKSCPAQLLSTRTIVNSRHIPSTAVASFVIFPKKIGDDPDLDLIPREIITAWGKKEFGFDPMLLNQATIVIRTMTDLQQPPTWAIVMHFDEIQVLGGTTIGRLEEKRLGGKLLFSSGRMGEASFLVIDEATILAGDESFFNEILTADDSGRLVEIIKQSETGGQLRGFVEIESIRPLLNQATAALPFWLPPSVMKLKQLPNSVEAIEVGITVDGMRATTDLVFQTLDPESAEKVGKTLTEALEFGVDMLIGTTAAQMSIDDPVQAAFVEYMQRVAAELLKNWTPEISGRQLTFQFNEEATVVPLLIGMLLPATQQVRGAARRSQSMNNMKQMTLALHNHESAYQSFPAQAITDKNGKPLLSWRVQILPSIEQQELYDQFHLDEPWDSPHNKKLIDKMPVTYRSPSVSVKEGHTVYLGIAGEGMMFGKDARQFRDFTDGTSNTVIMVEANPDLAVPWSKPADLQIDRKNPLKGLGGTQPGGFIANMADGSVRFIANGVDAENWLKMLTINGGEVVDADQ